MLMSFRKNSTVVIDPPVANALATKLTDERLCTVALFAGVVSETVGGVPTTVATFTVTGAETVMLELASVTRVVS